MSAPEGLPLRLAARLEDFERFCNDEMDRNINQSVPADPQAETIYHYTDVRGALGILTSGRFWLTERAHLNDPSEIKHGVDCAVAIADGLPDDPGCPVLADNSVNIV